MKAVKSASALMAAIIASSLFPTAAANADSSAQKITPGMTIYQEKTSSTVTKCTAAFLAKGRDTGTLVMLTAAHCKDNDRPVYYRNYRDNAMYEVGEFLDTIWDTSSTGAVTHDIAIVGVNPSMPYTTLIGNKYEVGDVVSPSDLKKEHVGDRACKFGGITGMTCGVISNVSSSKVIVNGAYSEQGDSGSPVYLMSESGVARPIGVLSSSPKSNDSILEATLIEPAMKAWNIEL